MAKLNVEVCPETGICSILGAAGAKADLMPAELQALREAGGDLKQLRAIIGEADPAFAATLSDEALKQLAAEVSPQR